MTRAMSKKSALLGMGFAVSWTLTFTAPAAAQPPADRQCTGDEALKQEIERFTTDLYRVVYPEAISPGFAVAIIRRNCDVFSHGFGYADVASRRPIDENSAFYIASATKALSV